MCTEEAEIKVREKLDKIVKGLEKDIWEIRGASPGKKRMLKKMKSRLDTGLESVRAAMQDKSRRDSKASDIPELKSNKVLSTKREEELSQREQRISEKD